MKALSAAWSAFFRTGTRPSFYVMIMSGADPWTIGGALKYYYVFPQQTLAWTGTFAEIDASRCEPGMLERAVFSFDERRRGGMASTGDFTFRVSNDGNFRSQLEADGVVFEGRECYLKLNHPGSTADYGADDLVIFSGCIKEVDLAGGDIEFRVETRDEAYTGLVPPRLFVPEGAEWATLQIAEPVRGKPVPLIFGDHDMAEAFTISDVYDDGTADRGRIIQFADVNWTAGVRLSSVEAIRWGDPGLADATGGFATINGATGKSVYTVMADKDKAYFESINPTALFLKLDIFPRSWIIRETHLNAGLDHRNALDDDATNYARQPAVTTNTIKNLSYKIPKIGIQALVEGSDSSPGYYAIMKVDPDDSGWASSSPWFHGWSFFLSKFKTQGAFGSNTLQWYQRAGAETPATTRDSSAPADYEDFQLLEYLPCTWTAYNDLSQLSQCYIGVGIWNDGMAAASPGINLHAIGLRVHAEMDWPAGGFYAHVRGYIDDTGGAITGTAGTLIENPAHVIAYLWSYLSQAGIDAVDVAGLRSLAGVLSGWKLARQLKETQDAIVDVVDGLCEQVGLVCWVSSNGTVAAFPLAAPHDSLIRDLREADVAAETNIEASLTPTEDVATSFVFRFRENPIRGDFDDTLICNDTEISTGLSTDLQALCANAKAVYLYGREKTVTVDLTWVRDRATALKVADGFIRDSTRRRWLLRWTEDLPAVRYEMGDAMRLASYNWQTQPDSLRAAKFRITRVEIDPAEYGVSFTAREV